MKNEMNNPTSYFLEKFGKDEFKKKLLYLIDVH